ncbi:DNA repair protein RecO [Pontiellaceae bacterium B12219]|nr:DNA repair protein RecO [Pontiellaceae bacterium B12219]
MIIKATAIPIAIFPYSSTSHIVHWLTRQNGKISTIIKGATRPKNRFLGEYELFSTTELLFFATPNKTLFTAKECSMLQSRNAFRTNWRAMQSASYITALFSKTTPEDAPHPELFSLYEELLDLAENHGQAPQFIPWAELHFSEAHGHAPNLGNCVLCSTRHDLRFCASQGGVVCGSCSKARKLPALGSPPDVLAILRAWQQSSTPAPVINTALTAKQRTEINAILSTFMHTHFNLNPHHRTAALHAA